MAIGNLLDNALKFSGVGGEVRVILEGQGGQASLKVSDNGPGIPPEDLPHIFEPFYTTKAVGYGVGLGLSTVFGIIQQHNGDIKVDSSSDRGSEFVIELPVEMQAPSPATTSH